MKMCKNWAPIVWDFTQDLGILMLDLGYFDFI